MHRGTARFARGHQARNNGGRVFCRRVQHFAPIVGGNAAHVVVHGGQNRDRFFGHVDTSKDLGDFRNARQTFGQRVGGKVVEVQEDVVAIFAPTPRPSRISMVIERDT